MRDRVLQVLLDSEDAMYLAEIAKQVKETSQLVQYHLNQLVEDGILLTYTEDRKRYYALQPVQYKFQPSELYEVLMPLIEDLAESINCEQSYESPSRILANNVILLLERLADDIDEAFEDDEEEDVNDCDECI